jgi:UDP-N-acetyl-D-mannosaminuronic acid transferase (WecB/TagA/CpsF family)
MLTQAPPEDRQLGPLVVHARSRADARRDIVGAVLHKEPLRVAFANVHLLYCALRDPSFASQLRDFYLVNDGVGIALLARLACGRGFRTNLNGTDLTPLVLAALPWGTRVMLVGARVEVVTHAAHLAAQHWPQLDICGCWDGFDGREQALAELNARAPDLVLVGMGNQRGLPRRRRVV